MYKNQTIPMASTYHAIPRNLDDIDRKEARRTIQDIGLYNYIHEHRTFLVRVPRQSGKTTWLEELVGHIDKCFYLPMTNPKMPYNYRLRGTSTKYSSLIIDEPFLRPGLYARALEEILVHNLMEDDVNFFVYGVGT